MHDDSKEYISCKPLLYGKTWKENAEIMEQKAFDNKEYIGTEYIYDIHLIIVSIMHFIVK